MNIRTKKEAVILLGLDNLDIIDMPTLRAAYNEAAKQWHPDRTSYNGDIDPTAATKKMARINQAFTLLRDEINRNGAILSDELDSLPVDMNNDWDDDEDWDDDDDDEDDEEDDGWEYDPNFRNSWYNPDAETSTSSTKSSTKSAGNTTTTQPNNTPPASSSNNETNRKPINSKREGIDISEILYAPIPEKILLIEAIGVKLLVMLVMFVLTWRTVIGGNFGPHTGVYFFDVGVSLFLGILWLGTVSVVIDWVEDCTIGIIRCITPLTIIADIGIVYCVITLWPTIQGYLTG